MGHLHQSIDFFKDRRAPGRNRCQRFMNLQESLYGIFQQANDPNTDKIERGFLAEAANQLYGDYSKAQNDLSQRIEIIAQMMEIRIDWASDPTKDLETEFDDSKDPLARGVFASKSLLSEFHFDGIKHPASLEFKRLELEAKDTKLSIDWSSLKHQVVTLYFCLDKMHLGLKAARVGLRQAS